MISWAPKDAVAVLRCAIVGEIAGLDGAPLSATVSAGCAAMGADGDHFLDIIARADVGLVMAKRAGRNRVIAA